METSASPGPGPEGPPGGPPPSADDRLRAARATLGAYLAAGGAALRATARLGRIAGAVRAICGGTLLLALVHAVAPGLDVRPLGAVALVALWLALRLARRAARARYAGAGVADALAATRPALADELRSFVELDEAARVGRMRGGDAFLLLLGERVGAASAASPIAALLPRQPARRALARSALLSFGGVAIACAISPQLLGELGTALRHGPRAVPAPPQPPIIGDLELTLTPPAYTGLPTRSIPASAGDVRALPGTEVAVRARSLVGAVRRAELRVEVEGAAPSATPAEVTRSAGERVPTLSGRFVVGAPGTYQFVLWRWTGRVTEPAPHRIEVEPDVAPRVELRAPADPLQLEAPRPVELLYEVEDDFGVADVALVWQVDGQPPQRRPLQPELPTPRHARGRLLWELGELEREAPLPPGARITYWIESHDNDAVRGPKLGRSAGLTIVVRGRVDPSTLDRASLESLLEQTIEALGDRLDRTGTEADRHEALQRVAGKYADVARGPESDASPKRPSPTTAALRRLAGEIARRLTALVTAEAAAPKPAQERIVAELERDILLLDDLRGRRRLEQMVRVSEEMRTARDELRRLFDELKAATTDAHRAELRREIERKLVALEAKMAELRRLSADAEGEVPDEFLNKEAIGKHDVRHDVDDIRKMLARGDLEQAAQELERMSHKLDQLSESLGKDLKGFRGERDPEAEKAMAALENDLADLAKEERDVERDSRAIRDRAGEAADRRADLKALHERLRPRLEELERRAAEQAREGMAFDPEKIERLRSRAQAIGRALDAADLDDAQAMARDAHGTAAELERTLKTIEAQLDGQAQARVGDGPPPALRRARARMGEAEQLAGQIEAELRRAATERRGKLTDEELRRLKELAQRQQSLQQRAEELSRRIGQRDAPGMGGVPQQIGGDLDGARQSMGEAARQLGAPAPGRGAEAAGQAAGKLEAAGRKMADARKNGDGGGDGGSRPEGDQVVKIPDPNDSAAPRAFREELLDAMKRGAPRKFEDQVRQYYEELVR